jgi:tetratricopeptide (TPR) repeat protein
MRQCATRLVMALFICFMVSHASLAADDAASGTAASDAALPDAAAYIARAKERMTPSKLNLDGAVADLDAAISLDPQNSTAYRMRGSAWMRKRDYDRAMNDAEKAVALDPSDPDALRLRANLLLGRGDPSGALADIEKAISLKPNDMLNFLMRGFVEISLKNPDKAIDDFTTAVNLQPNPEAYNQRASLYMNAKQLEKATQDFTKAIELDPKNSYAYARRGEALLMQGDFDGVIQNFQQAVSNNPENPGYKQSLAFALALKEQVKAEAQQKK